MTPLQQRAIDEIEQEPSANDPVTFARMHKIDNWVFEIKMVRALRVENYGEPYTATALLTVNGDTLYVDTQLSGSDTELGLADYAAFHKFAGHIAMEKMSYDRMKNGVRKSKVFNVNPQEKMHPRIKVLS